MDIIDDRHGKKSTLVSSQIPVSAWYEIIGGEGTIADAILDRIVNSSHRIDLHKPRFSPFRDFVFANFITNADNGNVGLQF